MRANRPPADEPRPLYFVWIEFLISHGVDNVVAAGLLNLHHTLDNANNHENHANNDNHENKEDEKYENNGNLDNADNLDNNYGIHDNVDDNVDNIDNHIVENSRQQQSKCRSPWCWSWC